MTAQEPEFTQHYTYGPFQGEFRYVFFTPVERFDQTVAFYRDTLGLPLQGGFGEPGDPMQGAYIKGGAGVIEIIADRDGSDLFRSVLQPGQTPQPAQGGYVLMEVENVDSLYTRLQTRGVNFTQPITTWPWGFRDFKLQDPCGNTVCLFSRVTPH